MQQTHKIRRIDLLAHRPQLRLLVLWALLSIGKLATAQQVANINTYFGTDSSAVKQSFYVLKRAPDTLHGAFYAYYPNGDLKVQGHYHLQVPDGLWTYYYLGHNVKVKGTLAHGKKHGTWYYYFTDGNLKAIFDFKNDKRHGRQTYFYEAGAVKETGKMQNDTLTGIWKYYYPDQSLRGKAVYKNNRATYTGYYPSGNTKMSGFLNGTQTDSLWTYYHPNQKISAQGHEKAGLRQDHWVFYDTAGHKTSEGQYVDNKKTGTWIYYHPNGTIKSRGSQNSDNRYGSWELFDTDGTLIERASYAIDSLGTYKLYYPDGSLKTEGKILNGYYEGIWKYYYPNGQLKGACTFKHGYGIYEGYYSNGKIKTQGPLHNDKKKGIWQLYHPDGTIQGYYHTANLPPNVDLDLKPPKPQPEKTEKKRGLPDLILNKKKIRYFDGSTFENRFLIISTNPIMPLFNFLPLSVEYMLADRMGFEAEVRYLGEPFGKPSQPRAGQIFYQGWQGRVMHRFYHPDRGIGHFYFAYGVFAQQLKLATDTAGLNQTRKNYTAQTTNAGPVLFAGDRLLFDLTKNMFISLDIYAGLGLGIPLGNKSITNQRWFSSHYHHHNYLHWQAGFNIGIAF